ETGFSRHELPTGVRSPSIDYTAYLSSPKIEKHYSDSSLAFDTMHEDIRQLVELAKDRLRKHIRLQMAKEAADVVEEWKYLEIYPYKEIVNPIEQVEKEVFDIVAARVNEQHPTFKNSDTDNKKLTLALIKQSLETNPSSLTSILRDVLKLSVEEQNEFADLLKRTTLSSIIRASSIVTQRLDTIRAFEYIIFDKEWKKKLLERTQLHRLLVHELWIFGEDYTLDNDDESLTQVLKKHIQKLGREELAEDIKVETIEGVQGIPDLLLSRRFTYSRDQFENLVIELKRPSVTLGQSELGQLEDYAITVSEDEMFDTNKCRWKFVLLGNNLNDYVKAKADQDGLPKDCAFKSKNGNVSVYVKCWADIFAEAKQRYEFFRKSLEIEAKKESGMEKWKNKYSHIITGRGASKKKDKEITQHQ
ncbi:MAG: hypothetical protein KAR20_24140, partial [Candidatus Heimdallarchaeota archaeon]|nr:hypothetical protein [Candidatus Heimdallarchaeota archaeon]